MISSTVMPAGGVGSRGPKPAGSCAAAPSGFATAAKAGAEAADSGKRRSARRPEEAATRIGRERLHGRELQGETGAGHLRAVAPHHY